MAAKKKKVHPQRYKAYKIEGSTVSRSKRACPRCGPGTFLAEHEDRFHCGRCRYTIFKEQAKAESEGLKASTSIKEDAKSEAKPEVTPKAVPETKPAPTAPETVPPASK